VDGGGELARWVVLAGAVARAGRATVIGADGAGPEVRAGGWAAAWPPGCWAPGCCPTAPAGCWPGLAERECSAAAISFCSWVMRWRNAPVAAPAVASLACSCRSSAAFWVRVAVASGVVTGLAAESLVGMTGPSARPGADRKTDRCHAGSDGPATAIHASSPPVRGLRTVAVAGAPSVLSL
jgi:hypothetical protein